MKIKKLLFIILLIIPAFTFAGEIFGTISKDGKPFAKQPVSITAVDGTVVKAVTTDATGYFSVTIEKLGPFKLKAGEAVADVNSNVTATGYNFVLIQQDSKWQLIKK
jgi:hypothetical protein